MPETELGADACLRCGEMPLESDQDRQTGICPKCWTEDDYFPGEDCSLNIEDEA